MHEKWLLLCVSIYFSGIYAAQSDEWVCLPDQEEEQYGYVACISIGDHEKGKVKTLEVPLYDRLVVIARTCIYGLGKYVHVSAYPPSLYGPNPPIRLQHRQHKELYDWWVSMIKLGAASTKLNVLVPLSNDCNDKFIVAKEWAQPFGAEVEDGNPETNFYSPNGSEEGSEIDTIEVRCSFLEMVVCYKKGDRETWVRDKIFL